METETRVIGAERAGEERITLKMADSPGWEPRRGSLILAAVWWAWCAYGWLTQQHRYG